MISSIERREELVKLERTEPGQVVQQVVRELDNGEHIHQIKEQLRVCDAGRLVRTVLTERSWRRD